MPWKLLGFIVLTAIVLTFVGFNLENRGDISVVFYTFKDVPVVVTLLASFLFGLLVAFFFSLGRAVKGGRKAGEAKGSPAAIKGAAGADIAGDSAAPFRPEPAKAGAPKPKAESGRARKKQKD